MLEFLILALLGGWLALALRSCHRRKGGCGGDCSACQKSCLFQMPLKRYPIHWVGAKI